MADNIKIVGNISSTNTIPRYDGKDSALIESQVIAENFGGIDDYIEYFIYDAANNQLIGEYNYKKYKLPPNQPLSPSSTPPPNTTGQIQTTNVGVTSTLSNNTGSVYPIIEIDPVQDIQFYGYSSGEFISIYNFFSNKISNATERSLLIKEISVDRTEVRLISTVLTDNELENTVFNIINEINNSPYHIDYLLNYGDNKQFLIVNIALNKINSGYEVLLKLYNPLPSNIELLDRVWVVEEKVLPYSFNINLNKLILPPPPLKLKGPNFGVPIPNQGTISTTYTSYLNAVTGLQSLQSSSFNQIMNLMNTQSIHINVDYTISESADFGNFVFLGSAYQRVSNFYDKVKLIEDYNNEIARLSPFAANTQSVQTTINTYTSSISTLVSQFDGYESYLYFESSSYTWPKSGSLKPYQLLSTGSTTALSWYNNQLAFAIDYDDDNVDNLKYAIPSYLRDDTANQPFITFLNMVGQYFDNIWIYIKAVTDVNLANNNLNKGISKDLVYNQLQSLGIKVYNSQAGEDVNQFLIGANTGSSVFDNNFTITGSYLNNIPRKDLLSELYKRIYHNLPLLLKTKGTVAGLDYLMTIFGIPNQTYYTVISGSVSESFYSPTGSNFTSSILNVKEFGGSLKSKLIDGYNNDKSRIVYNTIATGSLTGSVLSSMLGLQTFPTSSNQFRENDMHYVDVSFSPQTQIDAYASKSIASNSPSWSLDDYIGDPRQLYSSSYSDLDAQRKLYFQTGVSGYPPFTGSALDYNGFIRLIQFFDNALFKMIGDFVPERTSLSTGVTINSPVLERNKAVYAQPTVTSQSVPTAEYSASTISPIYNNFYNYLTGSKSEYYTGQLTGSKIDINYYFDYSNPNFYLGDWNVYNSQNSITKSINTNNFLHSDFNVLLNNVSQSVKSSNRYKWEPIFGTTSSISSSAELQDSYLSLKAYNNSRYDGMKVTSLTYNIYTSASYTGSDGRTIVNGDSSFGKYAAIDHTVRKLALFTQVKTDAYFPLKSDVALRYLVDEFGNLTELNQRNKNWEEVQNTFKSGDYTVISLFDNQKYSDQKITDGAKTIYNSGYTLDPIFYFSSSDATASFEYADTSQINMFKYTTYGGGGTTPDTGSLVTSSRVDGIYFYSTSQQDISTEWPSSVKNIFNDGTDIQNYNEGNCFSASFRYQPLAAAIGGADGAFAFGRFTVTTPGYYGFVFDNLRFNYRAGSRSGGYAFPSYSIYVSSSGQVASFTQTLYATSQSGTGGGARAQYFNNAVVTPFQYLSGSVVDFYLVRKIMLDGPGVVGPLSASYNYSESINAGGVFYSTLQGGIPLATSPFSGSSTSTQFCLDEQFATFYGYLFLPEGVGSNPSSSLYNTYGNVNYNFTVNPGDILKFVLFSVTYEYEIASVTQTAGTSLCFNLSSTINNAVVNSINKVSEVLILRRSKDETSILLKYTKRPGQTSYGFAIPQKLAPDVLANIDTITKEVKQKLLAEQSALTGSF